MAKRAGAPGESVEDRFRAAQGAGGRDGIEAAAERAHAALAKPPRLALVLAGLTGYALALAVQGRR